uniref:DUF6824 domain-containing protein n=1 Tax=Leptocylindrus danicus TaxID=163516 RepID=A0A6U2RCW2_9STRA
MNYQHQQDTHSLYRQMTGAASAYHDITASQFDDAEHDQSRLNIMSLLHRNSNARSNGLYHSLAGVPNGSVLLVRRAQAAATILTATPAFEYPDIISISDSPVPLVELNYTGFIRRDSNDSSAVSTLSGFSVDQQQQQPQQVVMVGIRAEDRNENDVLFGRGKGSNNYIGNCRFRQIVAQYRDTYFETRRTDKPMMARRVMDLVRNQVPRGRFLQFDSISGNYFEVSEDEAIRKTSQSLREGKLQRSKNKKQSEAENNLSTKKSSSSGPLKKRRLGDGNMLTIERDQDVVTLPIQPPPKKVSFERIDAQQGYEPAAPLLHLPCARQQLPSTYLSDSSSGSSVQHLRNLISRRYNQMQMQQSDVV